MAMRIKWWRDGDDYDGNYYDGDDDAVGEDGDVEKKEMLMVMMTGDDREHQQCCKSQVFRSFVTFSSKIWTVHKTTLTVVILATWQELHQFVWEPGDTGTFWALFLQAFHQCVYLFQTHIWISE